MWDTLPSGYDPCTEGYAENYFNRKDVQVALHANVTNLPYPYTPCRLVLQLTFKCFVINILIMMNNRPIYSLITILLNKVYIYIYVLVCMIQRSNKRME